MVNFRSLTLADYKHLMGKWIALTSLDQLESWKDPYQDMNYSTLMNGNLPYLDESVNAS